MHGYFGSKWSAPMLDDLVQVDAPVGQPCLWCEEGIKYGEQGLIMSTIDAGAKATLRPIHRECHIRMSLGSVAHIEGRCSCYVPGSKEEDPPGSTKRQAARAAYRRVLEVYGGVKR